MNWKRTLTDPSFWILLIANCYLVYKYEQNPNIFSTLVWLYWSQSVLYGLFTFLHILTAKAPATIKRADAQPTYLTDKAPRRIDFTAFLFLAHYGFFHVVYFVFLATMTKLSLFDWDFFKYYLAIFFVSQAISFIQHKIQKRTIDDFGKMLLTPYLRIIPMHLCILIPAFVGISSLTVFLVMKVVADVWMYVLTNSYYKRASLAELTAVNMNSTIASE